MSIQQIQMRYDDEEPAILIMCLQCKSKMSPDIDAICYWNNHSGPKNVKLFT